MEEIDRSMHPQVWRMLKDFNTSLLAKQGWRLITNPKILGKGQLHPNHYIYLITIIIIFISSSWKNSFPTPLLRTWSLGDQRANIVRLNIRTSWSKRITNYLLYYPLMFKYTLYIFQSYEILVHILKKLIFTSTQR